LGRRSRKRAASPGRAAPAPRAGATAAPPRRRSRRGGEPPPAPWGKFPLVELCVLIALVLGVTGFVLWGHRGQVMVACAAALGSLAGLELSIREHFAGYRSHTTVLAATAAVLVLGIMFFARVGRSVMLPVAGGVFVGAFWALREAFRRRSGGFGFR
jgi:hypothetical protein